MRLVRAELLHSPTRVLVLLVPAVMLLHLRTDSAWQAGWPDLFGGLIGAVGVAAPLVAAVTAYVVAGRVAPGVMRFERSTPRASCLIAAIPVVGALGHAVVGVLLGIVYPMALIARSVPGTPWPSSLVMLAVHPLLPVAVGAVIGRVTASRRVAPVIGLGVMYGFVALVGSPTTTAPWEVPSIPMSAVLGGAGAVTMLAALLVGPLRRGASRVILARTVSACALAVVAVGVAFSAGGEALMLSRDPVDPACTSDGRVCVWPEHAHHRDEIAAGLRRLDRYRDVGLRIDGSLYERGLRATEGPTFTYPPAWFAFAGMGSAVTDRFWTCGESATITDETVEASQRLMVWATLVAAGGPPPPSVGGGPDGVTMAEIDTVRHLPAAEERAWLRHQVDLVGRACG